MSVVASGPKRSSLCAQREAPHEPVDATRAGDARLLEIEHEVRDALTSSHLDGLAVELDERPLRIAECRWLLGGLRGHGVDCSAVGRLGSTHAEPRRRARREVRGDCRRLREGEPPARRGGRGGPRRRARVGGRSRFRRSRGSSSLRSEDALPHRLDHEDLHGHRDHAAARRGQARARRSCGRATSPSSRPRRARSARSRGSRSGGCSRTSPASRASRPARTGRTSCTRTTPPGRSRARRRSRRASRCTRNGSTRTSPTSSSERSSLACRARRTRQYIRSKILRPLGMTSTSLDPLSARLRARRATGYEPRFLSDELDLAPQEVNVFGAEGGLWSCVEDLARWLACQTRGRARNHREGHAEGDAQGPLSHRRRVDECVVHRLVRAAPRRRHLDHALGRLLRLHHERMLRAEGEGRRDRARQRHRERDGARAPARDDRARGGARSGAGDRGTGAAAGRVAAVRRPLHGASTSARSCASSGSTAS